MRHRDTHSLLLYTNSKQMFFECKPGSSRKQRFNKDLKLRKSGGSIAQLATWLTALCLVALLAPRASQPFVQQGFKVLLFVRGEVLSGLDHKVAVGSLQVQLVIIAVAAQLVAVQRDGGEKDGYGFAG